MEEGQIEAGPRLRRRDLRRTAIAEARGARGLQKESAMGVERGGFGGEDGDAGRRVLVRNVDCP